MYTKTAKEEPTGKKKTRNFFSHTTPIEIIKLERTYKKGI
jgi:hypothetical protein